MSRAAYLLLGVIYLGFVSLGLPDGTLGVAWPAIAGDLRLAVGLAGAIMLVLTLLAGLSSFSSGALVARFQTGPVVLASGALTAGGLLAIAHAPGLAWLIVAAVPLGLGAGAVDAALNGFVARHYSGRHMNWLHACWGLGATTGPFVMGEALRSGQGWRGGYFVLGVVQLGLAALFLATLRLWSAVPERRHERAGPGATGVPTRGAHSFAGWLSPVLFAVYVAVEGTTALWAASILTLSRGFAAETAAWCTGAYYAAITAGRVLVGVGVDRWGNRRVITLGVLLAVVGVAGFALGRSPLTAGAALVLMGLGFAPVYPGLMHEVPRRFAPEAVQIVIGRQSGAAYLGMSAAPAAAGWLAGYSLEGIVVAVAGGIVLLLVGIRRLDRMTPPAAGSEIGAGR